MGALSSYSWPESQVTAGTATFTATLLTAAAAAAMTEYFLAVRPSPVLWAIYYKIRSMILYLYIHHIYVMSFAFSTCCGIKCQPNIPILNSCHDDPAAYLM